MVNATTGKWPAAAIELCRKLWDEGKSTPLIANTLTFEFGFPVTKNAVIGRAHRMDFPKRKPATRGKNYIPKTKPIRARRNRKIKAPTLQPLSAATPGITSCDIMGLNNWTCRWPLGELREVATLYCGDPSADFASGHPYCPMHTATATGKPSGFMWEATRRSGLRI